MLLCVASGCRSAAWSTSSSALVACRNCAVVIRQSLLKLLTRDPPSFRSVADEKAALRKLPKLQMTDDPTTAFAATAPHKLELARRVALDVLSMPSGEAPCERVFSIASRVLGESRYSVGPTKLEQLVYDKKNCASFAEE